MLTRISSRYVQETIDQLEFYFDSIKLQHPTMPLWQLHLHLVVKDSTGRS